MTSSAEAIEDWLFDAAMRENDMLRLFEELCWRLVAAKLPVDRLTLHVGTLHPQLRGFAWFWSRLDGICDEVNVGAGVPQTASYLKSPLVGVIERGETFRADPRDPVLAAQFPLLAELADEGFTDYVALPLGGDRYHNVMTVATMTPDGLSRDIETMRRLRRVFALHVQRHIALRIAGNLLDIYLGAAAGARVLEGTIQRGAGEPICAVVFAADMRNFTALSERLAGPEMIALLNAYFEKLAGAVLAHGGEVLKFVGDGLLAVFPFDRLASPRRAAAAALAAARDAVAAVTAIRTGAGDETLRVGIGLHAGDVFFGNVGAAERLDFTVIGPAVNAAARVESLTRPLQQPILMTAAVADLIETPVEALGAHAVKGVAEPIAVFAPV